MAPIVHDFDWPDRFLVGTVGPPGARAFYLQARLGHDLISVALEKQQCALLADRIDELLDRFMAENGNPFSVPALAQPELIDSDPLDRPVEEQFHADAMGLGWDPSTVQVVIEAFGFDEPSTGDPVAAEPSEVLLVRIPVGAARAFAQQSREVVGAGRAVCSLCGAPMDPGGHTCTLPDGFR